MLTIFLKRKRYMIDQSDKVMCPGIANSILRDYGMDLLTGPTNISQLARNMNIVIINGSTKDCDVEYIDFSYAPEKMPDYFRTLAGKDNNRIVNVNGDLDFIEQLFLITGMLTFSYTFLMKNKEDSTIHIRNKEIRCAKLSKKDFTNELEKIKLVALCILISQMALVDYFKKNNIVRKEIVSNPNALNKFCTYFMVSKENAKIRLSLYF